MMEDGREDMAKGRKRITDEEFERMKEMWANEKSYADMTWEEIEEHFRELGLPPPAPLEKVVF